MNPLGDGPFSPFTSSSELEVASIGNGRATVGRPDPFEEFRNPASRALKKMPSQVELDAAMRKALRGLVWTPKPDPIPDDLWRQVDEITAIAGAAPIIGRLPVDFNTFEVGNAFRDEVKVDDSIWKGADFAYGSNDPKIAAAAMNVFDVISKDLELAQRVTDRGLAYGAVAAVRDGVGKPAASGVVVTGRQSFAQLGVTPFVRLFATGKEVRDLYDRGLLAGVYFDSEGHLDLDETTDAIGSDWYQSPQDRRQWEPSLRRWTSGSGVTVAVIDSGVDVDHPAFPRGTIVDGACFDSCDGQPNSTTVVTTIAASNHCDLSASPGCDHGTHLAGIIAGRPATLPNGQVVPAGVAPSAEIASYRVCSSANSCVFSVATQALGRVATLAAPLDIAAANLSIGTPNRYQFCPSQIAFFNDPSFATAVGVASAAGVTVINSNGNGSRFNWGACDPTMMVVANATKGGQPRFDTNFHFGQTTLWAPGTSIYAASTDDAGGANVEFKSGTSMAAPHVAGAIALIDQAVRQYNGDQSRSQRVTFGQVRNLMLGIAPIDPGRTMIFDNRRGTDDQGNTASGAGAPELSLRNLWMLLAGGPLSQQTTVPTYTPTFRPAVVEQTPRNWTVTSDPVRKEYNGGAIPLRGAMTGAYGSGSRRFAATDPARLAPLSGRTILDGPYLYAYSANGSVASVRDAAGNELPIQQIAKGPQPCTRAGWLEIVRVPITAAQHDSEDLIVRVEGPEPRAVLQVEATVDAGGITHAVATDPRPLVFGGSRTFPDPVDLGAHRPDITNTRAWINWFDLDRITGDELMLNDASNAGSYSILSGTRVPNAAVAQDFFFDSQTSMAVVIPAGTNESVIGWQETPGYQDCAVALGHIWMGRQ